MCAKRVSRLPRGKRWVAWRWRCKRFGLVLDREMHGCMLVTCLHPNASLNQYTQTNRYQPDTRYMPFLSPPLKLYRQPAAPLYIHTYATSPYTILSQPISYSYSITTPLHRCIGHITIYFLPQAFESSLPRSYFQS